jgi:hypothetical protein
MKKSLIFLLIVFLLINFISAIDYNDVSKNIPDKDKVEADYLRQEWNKILRNDENFSFFFIL